MSIFPSAGSYRWSGSPQRWVNNSLQSSDLEVSAARRVIAMPTITATGRAGRSIAPWERCGVTFGVHLAKIAAEFKLDIEDRLASILPANAEADSGDDDRRPARRR